MGSMFGFPPDPQAKAGRRHPTLHARAGKRPGERSERLRTHGGNLVRPRFRFPDIAPCGGQIPELFTAGNSDHTCSVYLGRVAGKCRIRRAFPQLGCVPMPVRFLLAGMNSQLAFGLPVVVPSDTVVIN